MIASCSEDTTVKIWQIPDDGLGKTNLTEPLLTLEGLHQRKVHQILWHPTASNILLSASYDPLIVIWNLESGEAVVEIDCHPDLIYSVDWNTNGSLIATTCKDKKIRVIDARKGTVVKVGVNWFKCFAFAKLQLDMQTCQMWHVTLNVCKSIAYKQALWGALAVGREKEGELATMSLKFEYLHWKVDVKCWLAEIMVRTGLEKSLKIGKLWDILEKSLNFLQKSLNIFESSLNKSNLW